MIPPLSEEEYERLIPTWAKKLNTRKHFFKKGDRVYDVLYGTREGNPFGTVVDCSDIETEDGQWLAVDHDDGSQHGTTSRYYVPVPPEWDDSHLAAPRRRTRLVLR